ncbi:MAG TPA: branched-chain amino acid ABC transporter permease [Clostridia bacterium]|nr:branched-chain amino acid ABC transporter permease [Clostridia bacterium]
MLQDYKKYLPNIIILFLVGMLGVAFGGSQYLILLLCIIGIYIIAVSGLDILFGYSGQISLGHAAFFAIGAYTSAIFTTKFPIPVWIGMLLGATLATMIAIMIAFPAAKLVHHFLALLTISFGQLVFIFVSKADNITNGMSGIIGIPPIKLGPLVFDTNLSFFALMLVLVTVFLVIKQRIVNSRVGRALIAIRENPHAASGMGINVRYYKIMAFAISAFFTGFSGALYAHFICFISPESFMYSQSVLFLTMLLFGGTGNLYGPIIGSAVLTIISESLQSVGNYQMLVYGFFLMAVILFLPKGLYGIVDILKAYMRKMVKKSAEVK